MIRPAILSVALLSASCATPHASEDLIAFEAALDGDDSATRVLERWCTLRGMADPARVRAQVLHGPVPPLDAQGRLAMGLGPHDELGYRHVRLWCGGRMLSEAHNWYVPAYLSDAMRQALDETDVPFGQVAAPLGFRRERVASLRGRGPGCPPGTVLTHQARLRLPDGRVLASLIECYDGAIMARGPAHAPGRSGPPPG